MLLHHTAACTPIALSRVIATRFLPAAARLHVTAASRMMHHSAASSTISAVASRAPKPATWTTPLSYTRPRLSSSLPRSFTPLCYTQINSSSCRRHFASSSSSSSSSGRSTYARSQALAAHFVPFSQSLRDAEAAYLQWARRQLLAPESIRTLSDVAKVDQAYLPFYAFDLRVVSKFGGRIGFDTTEMVFNPVTKQWQMQTRTNWRRVPMGQSDGSEARTQSRSAATIKVEPSG